MLFVEPSIVVAFDNFQKPVFDSDQIVLQSFPDWFAYFHSFHNTVQVDSEVQPLLIAQVLSQFVEESLLAARIGHSFALSIFWLPHSILPSLLVQQKV